MPRNSNGMYQLPAGNPVVPGTIIDSVWANTTMEDLGEALTNSLPRNGAAPMTGPLTLSSSSPSNPLHAASKGYVDSFIAYSSGMPIGAIVPYAGATTPVGWLLCDGAAVSRTQYAQLFAIVGVTYGAGDGVLTFNLPDLRNEFVRGLGSGRAVGSKQAGSFASHSHNVNDPMHTHTANVSEVAHSHPISLTTGADGLLAGSVTVGTTLYGSVGGLVPGSATGVFTTSANTIDRMGGDNTATAAHSTLSLAAPAHTHTVNGGTGNQSPTNTVGVANLPGPTGITLSSTGGSETVPQNMALNYFIKAVSDSTASVPTGDGQTFLGFFSAASGALPQAVFPTVTFVSGDTYQISEGGNLFVFDPVTGIGSTTAVTADNYITWVTDGTSPEGWYLTHFSSGTPTSATAVSFVPSGSISATNVQAAIEELDTERLTIWVNVRQFGAIGDGVTDDTVAFQNAIAFAQQLGTNGIVYAPTGFYKITSNLVFTWPNTSVDGHAVETVLRGDGSNLTYLYDYRPGSPSGGLVSYDMSSHAGAAFELRYLFTWTGGFTALRMVNPTTVVGEVITPGTGTGLYLRSIASGAFKDMLIDSYNIGIDAGNCLGSVYRDVAIYRADIGLQAQLIAGAPGGVTSPPNAVVIDHCTVNITKTAGLKLVGGNVSIVGSSFSFNGYGGTAAILAIVDSQLAKTLTVDSCMFEANSGTADIVVQATSGSNKAAVGLSNNTFVRNASVAANPVNNIRIDLSSAVYCTLALVNNGFKRYTGTASASTPVVGYANSGAANTTGTLVGNVFGDAAESPDGLGTSASITLGTTRWQSPDNTQVGYAKPTSYVADGMTYPAVELSDAVYLHKGFGLVPVADNVRYLGYTDHRWAAGFFENIRANSFHFGTYDIGAPPGGTTQFLRADGTWAVPPGAGSSGAVQQGGIIKSVASAAITLGAGFVAIQDYNTTAFTTSTGISYSLSSGVLTFSKAGNYTITVNLLCTYTPDTANNRYFGARVIDAATSTVIAETTVYAAQYTGGLSESFTFGRTIDAARLTNPIIIQIGNGASFANFVVGAATFIAVSNQAL